MTRQLTFLSAFCLLSFFTLKAYASPTTYRSSCKYELDNAPSLTGMEDCNDFVSHAASLIPGRSHFINAEEPCTELNSEGYESSFGIWIDGGSNCERSTSFPNSGSFSVQLRNAIGITSSMFTQNQNFVGMGVNIAFSYYPQGYETYEGFVLEYATDGGTIYTGYAAWVRGIHFQNNTRYNVSVVLNGMTWTTQSRLRLRSVGSSNDDLVYIDDVVISNCCQVGASCNDNSQCTINDVVNANCQCQGTYQDADSDGTCDAFDICPGLDDYLVESQAPCDDGDPCTVGDHLDSDICGCEGQYIDWDQDGYCQSEDPNDVDACIPDPENPACNPCITHDNAHFESNFQIWNSGGNDCSRVYAPQHAYAGNYCVRIQDNSGAQSSMFTDNINLAGLNNVSVTFFFKAVGMEVNEDFLLEYSTNGGGSYTVVDSWSRGTDFENNSVQYRIVPVTGVTWTSQSRFRFRCDASANDDQVYIDDVIIRSCLNFPMMQAPEITDPPVISNDHQVFNPDPEDLILSPNPVS
ncbi:MAG TPA: hypothetical protein VGK46_09170, partial [Saprospiraceae bacterium]